MKSTFYRRLSLVVIMFVPFISGCKGSDDSDSQVTSYPPLTIVEKEEVLVSDKEDGSNTNSTDTSVRSIETYSSDKLLEFLQEQGKPTIKEVETVRAKVFEGLTSVPVEVNHDSVYLTNYAPDQNILLIDGYSKTRPDDRQGLVYFGERSGHRYIAAGVNIFSKNTGDESVNKLRMNLVSLLLNKTKESIVTDGLKVVVSQVPSKIERGYYFPHYEGMNKWLASAFDKNYTINALSECDYEKLQECLDEYQPDMVFLSSWSKRNNDAYRRNCGTDSDCNDKVYSEADTDYRSIKTGIEAIVRTKTPLVLLNYDDHIENQVQPVYSYMGLEPVSNAWRGIRTQNESISDIPVVEHHFNRFQSLLDTLSEAKPDSSVYLSCGETFYTKCKTEEFNKHFKDGAEWLKSALKRLDARNENIFAGDNFEFLKAAVLLGEKYRVDIDYPIPQTESQSYVRSLYADWSVYYSRTTNLPQKDLGEFVKATKDNGSVKLEKGEYASFKFPSTSNDEKSFEVDNPNQWTSTGWFALPGQEITLERKDSHDFDMKLRLNSERWGTNKVTGKYNHEVRRPTTLTYQNIVIPKDGKVSFSSPYGGPIYFYFVKSPKEVVQYEATIKATGIAFYPFISDLDSESDVSSFIKLYKESSIPYIDIKSKMAEWHIRRANFDSALDDDLDVETAIRKLLELTRDYHIKPVYTLAGLKLQGKDLKTTLPADVLRECKAKFGEVDCTDNELHSRSKIQHANYNQNAQCGIGCSGNPWDSGASFNPVSYLDNHELGHNLQNKLLNTGYVEQGDSNLWEKFSGRATENSNNIFPYYILWKKHYFYDNNTASKVDNHSDGKTLFAAYMSDLLNAKNSKGEHVVLDSRCKIIDNSGNKQPASRFESPWYSNAYAAENKYRQNFYLQMALLADGKYMTSLDNGYHIWTLLYQHARIFQKYAQPYTSDATQHSENESVWMQNRDRLGFSDFSYMNGSVYGSTKTIANIPGNDFLLVSLSYITGYDWTQYFDLFGLRTTDLAKKQAVKNGKSGKVTKGMYALGRTLLPKTLSKELRYIDLENASSRTKWLPSLRETDTSSKTLEELCGGSGYTFDR